MPGIIAIIVLLLLAVWLAVGNVFYKKAIQRDVSKSFLNEKPKEEKEEIMPQPPAPADEYAEAYQSFAARPAEVWKQESFDGFKLVAHYYPAEDPTSHRWALVVHGYTGQGRHMGAYSYGYHLRGFHVLAPDNRGHGESEGYYIGMGWHDRLDVTGWIREIVRRDPKAEILLTGVSMGEATVMMAAGEEQPDNLRCVVEDCGYTSVEAQFTHNLKALFKLPKFPVLAASELICRWRAGYGFKEASSLKQLQKSRLPILFIHGGDDDFVPTEMVHKLYNAYQGEKDLLIVEGAGHAVSIEKDREGYWAKVDSFVKQYIPY